MEMMSVITAAGCSFAWGAFWYMTFAKQWMAAAQMTDDRRQEAGFWPFVVAIISCILVAGMMRHIFVSSNIDGGLNGVISGLGIGLFIAVPWLATTYSFGMRSKWLILIDAGYVTGGCMFIGLVLGLF